jgi:ABC-type transporter Mla subunit MlaD
MSRQTHYFRIGLFVIVAVGLAVAAVILLGSQELYKKSILLETYINESVQGLDIGSPVKLRGVKIGQVSQITFVDNVYQTDHRYVLVRAKLRFERSKSMTHEGLKEELAHEIKNGLRVRLASQGLTGTAFLEADYLPPERYPPLKIDWEPVYLYVPSAPSVITQLSDSLQKILDKLGQSHVERMAISANELVTNLTVLITRDLTPIMTNVSAGTRSLPETVDAMNHVIRRIDTLVVEQQSSIEETLGNFRSASRDLKQIMENVRENPASVLLSKPPPEKRNSK